MQQSKQFASPEHTIVQQKLTQGASKKILPGREARGVLVISGVTRVPVQLLILGTKKGALLEATPLILFC